MDSRTTSQAWSRGLEAGKNCKYVIIAEPQSANVAYLKKKPIIRVFFFFSFFFAYPDGSPFPLIRISGVLLYYDLEATLYQKTKCHVAFSLCPRMLCIRNVCCCQLGLLCFGTFTPLSLQNRTNNFWELGLSLPEVRDRGPPIEMRPKGSAILTTYLDKVCRIVYFTLSPDNGTCPCIDIFDWRHCQHSLSNG